MTATLSTPVVYIAGSRSLCNNDTARLVDACRKVLDCGGAYILSDIFFLSDPEHDRMAEALVPCSDAVFCVDRENKTAQEEIRIAFTYDLPVFYTLDDLSDWMRLVTTNWHHHATAILRWA